MVKFKLDLNFISSSCILHISIELRNERLEWKEQLAIHHQRRNQRNINSVSTTFWVTLIPVPFQSIFVYNHLLSANPQKTKPCLNHSHHFRLFHLDDSSYHSDWFGNCSYCFSSDLRDCSYYHDNSDSGSKKRKSSVSWEWSTFYREGFWAMLKRRFV